MRPNGLFLRFVSKEKKDQIEYTKHQPTQFSYPKKISKKRTKDFLKSSPGENDVYHDEYEKEYKVTYARIYTDKARRVKKNALTTKKFERILINVSNKRPNTLVILFLSIYQGLYMIWDGIKKWILSIFTGEFHPLKSSRTVKIWNWIALQWPQKFWKFPRSIQIGRSLSTLIQIIFYPKK